MYYPEIIAWCTAALSCFQIKDGYLERSPWIVLRLLRPGAGLLWTWGRVASLRPGNNCRYVHLRTVRKVIFYNKKSWIRFRFLKAAGSGSGLRKTARSGSTKNVCRSTALVLVIVVYRVTGNCRFLTCPSVTTRTGVSGWTFSSALSAHSFKRCRPFKETALLL